MAAHSAPTRRCGNVACEAMAGEEVEVTPDGRVLRISGTTLNR
jgi:hypothetical protein